ncbi:MAG: hypothetical protein HFE60_09960 [Anaerotignum sp.]|nr:hypothetical protein [Anaerotignum sp.]
MSGVEIARYHKAGKEYILAKDLLPLGFEAVWEGNTLFLDCTTPKSQLTEKYNSPTITPSMDLMIKLNGINIDYKMVHGEIALSIDDLCSPKADSFDDISHPEEYYTAFQHLGYSAYYFRRNSSDSISVLPLEKSVVCNMGETSFAKLCKNVTNTEMEKYFDLESVLQKMNAVYKFQDNILDIYEDHFQRLSISVPDQATNYTSLRYPVLAAEIMTADMQKISAYIVKGRLKVNTAEFCEAYGYHTREENSENSCKMIIIEK